MLLLYFILGSMCHQRLWIHLDKCAWKYVPVLHQRVSQYLFLVFKKASQREVNIKQRLGDEDGDEGRKTGRMDRCCAGIKQYHMWCAIRVPIAAVAGYKPVRSYAGMADVEEAWRGSISLIKKKKKKDCISSADSTCCWNSICVKRL